MTTIRCTFPPTKLGQTAGAHWRPRAAMIKDWRVKWGWEFVRYKEALQNKTHFKISFAPPDKRRRDIQNAQVAAKALLDALSDVVGIDDSKFRIVWNPDWLAPVDGGAVFVEVME